MLKALNVNTLSLAQSCRCYFIHKYYSFAFVIIYSFFHHNWLDIPLTMSQLTLMKWIDEFGEPHYFRFLEKVCGRWMELGDLLEISASQLMGLQVQYMNSNRLCCRDIFCSWLNGKCTDRYAMSWNGLLTLLQDADDSMTYKGLIMALHHSR